jgi:hypothetical protein
MKKATFFLYLVATSLPSLAGDIPTAGIAYNTKETNSIVFRCNQTKASTIDCEFNQTRVLPALKSEQSIKNLSIAREEFKKGTTIEKEECDRFQQILDIIDGKETEKTSNAPELLHQFKNKDDISFLKAGLIFCKKPTEENFIEMTRIIDSKKTRTCLASSNTFKQSYILMRDTGAWIAQSKPTGDCGIVDLSRFDPDKSLGSNFTAWNFIAKKAITNPNGTLLLGQPCSGLDEEEYLFSWQNRTWPMQCDYVEFSPL